MEKEENVEEIEREYSMEWSLKCHGIPFYVVIYNHLSAIHSNTPWNISIYSHEKKFKYIEQPRVKELIAGDVFSVSTGYFPKEEERILQVIGSYYNTRDGKVNMLMLENGEAINEIWNGNQQVRLLERKNDNFQKLQFK